MIYKNIWYQISDIPMPHKGLYEGSAQFGEYFFQVEGETYDDCENKIKNGIDFMRNKEPQ